MSQLWSAYWQCRGRIIRQAMFALDRSKRDVMTPRTLLPRRTSPLLTWACFACLALWGPSVSGQVVDQTLGGVNPGVKLTAVSVSGHTLDVGGSFTSAGPVSGGGANVDPLTAAENGSRAGE